MTLDSKKIPIGNKQTQQEFDPRPFLLFCLMQHMDKNNFMFKKTN